MTRLFSSPQSFLANAFLLSASVVGCVPKFEDDLSVIRERRIIAIEASPPEAAPGDSVVLRAKIAAPLGDSAAADRVTYAVCVDRKKLTELGPVSQACIDDFPSTTTNVESYGQGEAVTVTIPEDACTLFGPTAPVNESGSSARPVDPDSSGGYYVPVVVGEGVPSLGGVRVSCGAIGLTLAEQTKYNAGYRPNENPVIDSLLATVGGKEVLLKPTVSTKVKPGSVIEVRAEYAACPRQADCGNDICDVGENQTTCAADCRGEKPKGCTGAESYYWADSAARKVVVRRESMTIAWFTDGGSFDNEQTGRLETDSDGRATENVWRAPEKAGLYRVWLVIRDDRGGATALERNFEVAP